ncbi:mycothiol synthase [Aestuariimicrobium ganziense]|uniref:mycothiol synthase n=1 Tax=Aestuariimicrobium ganziense TaxID=2773677 RepID=UPI001940C2A9|nr:mycothiol synthase [Aestuariimicrobium ganziense]
MDAPITSGTTLPSPWREQIEDWLEAVTRADGVRPVNDLGLRMLRGDREGRFWWVERSGALLGVALLDPADRSVQVVVDPTVRRQGLGRRLAEQVLAADPATWWSFGTLPGAQALAARLGLEPVRQLLKMRRDLSRAPLSADEISSLLPTGTSLTGFTDPDLDDLVRVNAAAFADHPEQGAMTADDFRVAMAEDWFSADDLLLVRQDDTGDDTGGDAGGDTGDLLAFHWTKTVGDDGEVYVIGVAPEHDGRGLGRALLAAGLAHMARRGARSIHLFVEAANTRVVTMYESASFEVELRDTSWAASPTASSEDLDEH